MISKHAKKLYDSMVNAPISGGATQLRKHLRGGRLTRGQAISAKCCDCNCYYVDGKKSCEMPECPLFPYMPRRNAK